MHLYSAQYQHRVHSVGSAVPVDSVLLQRKGYLEECIFRGMMNEREDREGKIERIKSDLS